MTLKRIRLLTGIKTRSDIFEPYKYLSDSEVRTISTKVFDSCIFLSRNRFTYQGEIYHMDTSTYLYMKEYKPQHYEVGKKELDRLVYLFKYRLIDGTTFYKVGYTNSKIKARFCNVLFSFQSVIGYSPACKIVATIDSENPENLESLILNRLKLDGYQYKEYMNTDLHGRTELFKGSSVPSIFESYR